MGWIFILAALIFGSLGYSVGHDEGIRESFRVEAITKGSSCGVQFTDRQLLEEFDIKAPPGLYCMHRK